MLKKCTIILGLALAPLFATSIGTKAFACWNCLPNLTCDNTNPFGGGLSCFTDIVHHTCTTFGTCTGM